MSVDAINHDDTMTESEFRKIILQDLQLIKEKLDIQEKRTVPLQMILVLPCLSIVTLHEMNCI